jgi:phage major head subunit gpT-like protein
MIINRANLSILYTGFQSAFNEGFAGAPADHKPLTMEVNSSTSIEQYGWLGSTTGFRKWVGDRVIQNLTLHDYSIKNEPFENTVGVDADHIDDDTYGLYSVRMKQMGQDSAEHPSTLIWPLLKAGFSTPCYDGQFMFDTDHPVLDANGVEQSVSNYQAGAGEPWFLIDTTRVMKPIILQKRKPYNFVAMDSETDNNVFMRKEYLYGVDARMNVGFGLWQLAYASKATLDTANFNTVYENMMGMKGDNGRPLGLRPSLLVTGPKGRAAALEAVKVARQANGADNANYNVVDVLVTPWLA